MLRRATSWKSANDSDSDDVCAFFAEGSAVSDLVACVVAGQVFVQLFRKVGGHQEADAVVAGGSGYRCGQSVCREVRY